MMRALRVQIVASLLAGLLTAGAAFSPVAAFAPSSVGLSRRSPMRPAGACAMTARAESPPNVAELMEKAKLRIDETSVAVAGQKEVWNGERLPLPGFDLASFGLAGRWEEEEGSFFLEPPRGVEARGIVHFLGGAFVGAAPHISYRAMLEAIADEGYAIVATPYALQFDYIDLCQGVVARSAGALRAMQERYPALPMFGLGHSCGSLLHTILASAFDELPPLRAHALLSFNNKPAAESIPQFEELVAPFSAALMDPGQQAADARRGVEQALRDAQAQARRLAGSALAPKAVEAELIPLAEQSFKVVSGARRESACPTMTLTVRVPRHGAHVLRRLSRQVLEQLPDLLQMVPRRHTPPLHPLVSAQP